jgi:phosphonatase-like hydrolase
MIRLVVFDMAGTTVDENNVVYKTIHKVLNEAGFEVSLDEVLLHCAGKEKLQSIRDILRNVCHINDEEKTVLIHNAFGGLLAKAYEDLDVKPVTGAEVVFRYLRSNNVFCVLNTGYDADTANILLQKLGWDNADLIDGVVTASDVPRSRPFPDMIEAAMRLTGISDPIEVIKIGDSVIDIQEGQKAGCGLNVGITGGAQTREQLEQQGPDYVIDKLSEIIHIVERENRATSYVY